MSEGSTSCPKCGAAIPPEAPQGLCPKCLLKQASFPTETGAATRHSRPAPPDREDLSKAFPHLEILELIGQGGMGFVYKARQPKLDRIVALKILAQPLAEQTMFAERFTREGRTLAKLNHPNIVTIHDFGQAGPYFYLLMEYVDGVNLRQAMKAGAINSDQALAIVPRICEALQYAHNEGVLHRDIKPDNILLDARGRVKIADFGIAKLMAEAAAENPLTGSGASLGTPHYMAPEQIEKPNTVDHRADIYSLGVVFYEMLTGELPLGRFGPPSEKSGSDPRLDEIVFQTLEKQPERRPQSANEVKTKVETISTAPHAPRKASRTTTVLKAAAILVALVLVGLVGAVGLYTLLRKSMRQPADLAPQNAGDFQFTSNAIPNTSDRKINITSVFSTNNAIALHTSTEPAAANRFVPMIRYGLGLWGEADNVVVRQEYRRGPNGPSHDGLFMWGLPNAFSSGYETAAAILRARSEIVQRPFPISNASVAPIFELTNSAGQNVFLGLRLDTVPVPSATPPVIGSLSRFSLQTTVLNNRTFLSSGAAPDLPPGYRIQAVAHIGGKEVEAKTYQEADLLWNFWALPDTYPGTLPVNSARTITISYGKPVVVYTTTNYAASLELVPMPGVTPPQTTTAVSQSAAPETPAMPSHTDKLLLVNQPYLSDVGFDIRSETDMFTGEAVAPVIRYMSGAWEPTDAFATEQTTRGPFGVQRRRDFSWRIPSSFTLEFERRPALRQFISTWPNKALPLADGEITPLIAMTNSQGQIISCGLKFTKTDSPRQPGAKAILRNYSLDVSLSRPSARFAEHLPPGFRIEASATVNGLPKLAWTRRNSSDSFTQVHWDVPAGFDFGKARRESATQVEFTAGQSAYIFSATNAAGHVYRAYVDAISTDPKTFVFDSLTTATNYIVLRSETPLQPGEQLRAIIEDSSGNQTRALSSLTVRNTAKDSHTAASLMWRMPENAPTDWLETTSQQIRETILNKPIQLIEGGRKKLFHIQTESSGIQKIAAVVFESLRAGIEKTNATVEVKSSFPLDNGAILHFNADIPPGYRLEAECEPAESGSEARLDCSDIAGNEHYNAIWTFGLGRKLDFTEPIGATLTNTMNTLSRAPIHLNIGESKTIFLFKTPSRGFRAILKLTARDDR